MKRPAIALSVIAVVFLLAGVFLIIPGLALLYPGISLSLGLDLDTAGKHLALHFDRLKMMVFCLTTGSALTAAGAGLWKLRNWGRILAQALLSLLVLVTGLVAVPPPTPKAGDVETGFVICAVSILVIWYLRRPAIKARFRRAPDTAVLPPHS
jgi:hypothetical protein